MGLASAFKENGLRVIPLALLAVIGWLLIGLLSVSESMNLEQGIVGGYIGHAPMRRYACLAVILITLLFAIYLFAAAGETDPAPERFPPQ